MKNVAVLTEDGAFALFFRPPPWGICQLESPHPREFAIQGKKNANAQGQPGGEGGGLCWAQLELPDALPNRFFRIWDFHYLKLWIQDIKAKLGQNSG